jgi:CheY-like chemotaxis protein
MVYSTVKAHQGQMEIQSEPGHGTRVMIRFPVCEAVPRLPESVAEICPEPSTRGLRVLLVDDDELIQRSTLAILEALGHRVTAVLNGEAALAHLEAGYQPDVVILDMNMPGLGGAGTLPRLRALNPTVPVLLATGRVDQFATDVAAGHPFVTLLSKPFGKRELQKQLEPIGRG